ncbi:MAG: bifunctional DNA primase/polymerase [Actinomycetota bacterium]
MTKLLSSPTTSSEPHVALADHAPDDTPAHHAEAYVSLGWRVVPITPGRKYPPLKAWQDAATDDLDTVREWWRGPYSDHGVGILAGPDSGFWVLDVDTGNKDGMASLATLTETHGDLPITATALTGSGGLHLLFTWNPEHPVTNGDATRLGPGLDIRGLGGQIVAAPTIHPNGTPYRWTQPPWRTPVAAAPDWLYEIIHPPAPPEPTGHRINLPTPSSDDESPAEWVRANLDWATELAADGWQHHSTHAGDTWWTRPGKPTRWGHSAVLHGTDGPLVVFTTEISFDLARTGTPTADGLGRSYSLFSYLAGARHRGDTSAAARAINDERRPPATTTARLTVVPEPDAPSGFVDLGDWWDNPRPPKQADLAIRTDGIGLLYVDQLNWVHGDSGSGKTWVVLHAMTQLLKAGRSVAWVHYEDPNPGTIVERLRLLGLDRNEVVDRFHYWDPQGAPLDALQLLQLCEAHDVTHVALDSVGEALNAEGLNEDSDAEVGPWIAGRLRPLVNAGIGVTPVDHGTKAAQQPLYPSGSKRKRAAVTGAALLVEAIEAPTRDRDGTIRLTCAKDRHGNHPQGRPVGMAELRHHPLRGIDFTIATPVPSDPTGAAEESPEAEMVAAVVRAVASWPGLSKTQLGNHLPAAGRDRRHTAIDQAVNNRHIKYRIGPRNSQLYYPINWDFEDDP